MVSGRRQVGPFQRAPVRRRLWRRRHPGHDDYQSDRRRAAITERRPPGAGGVPLGASCCLNGRSTGGNPRRTAREQRGSSGVLDGSGGGTRTPDTRIMIPRSEERREGKRVSVRVDRGGRRLMKKKNSKYQSSNNPKYQKLQMN